MVLSKANEDQKIEALETQFPAISGSAFMKAQARDLVLASGQSVLQTRNGVIYEVFPDGRSKPVKKVQPPVRLVPGRTFLIK